MIGGGAFWERFDARSAAVLISSGGGALLPAFALGSTDYIRPGMVPALLGVWLIGGTLFLFTARVGRLTDRQFAVVGIGTMVAVAVSAWIVTDPAASRATVALLAGAPAIAAMTSTARTTLGFTVVAIVLASTFSVLWSASTVGAIVAVGASVLTVVIPVFLVVVLRGSLEFAMEKAARVSEVDPLTKALNRRGLTRRHARVFDVCTGQQQAIAFLLIDIDHFKMINDTHGHAAGDAVLVDTVSTIRAAAPAGSLVSRIGGEEFVVMFPVSSVADISASASRIREDVAASGPVTVSIGAVFAPLAIRLSGPPNASEIIDHLTRLADRSVYRAKSLGRDRVEMQTSTMIRWRAGLASEAEELDHERPARFQFSTLVRSELVRQLNRGSTRRAAS